MVWSLERRARSIPQLVTTIDKLLCSGARLRTISEGINTTDPDTGTDTRRMLATSCKCHHDLHLEPGSSLAFSGIRNAYHLLNQYFWQFTVSLAGRFLAARVQSPFSVDDIRIRTNLDVAQKKSPT